MIGALSVGENELMRLTRAKEVTSPASPPRMAMTTDSTRIWVKMSLVAAPTDLRMPISRTRSEMLASMMFMMPMPPTSRLMPAMRPPLSRALWMKVLICSAQSSCVRKVKSSMPLWVHMSTLRTCWSASGSRSTLAILASRPESRGSPVVPVMVRLPPP